MMRQLSSFESFEDILDKRLQRNNVAAQEIYEYRVQSITNALDALSRPYIEKMLHAEKTHEEHIERLKSLQQKLASDFAERWTNETIKTNNGKMRLGRSNMPTIFGSNLTNASYTDAERLLRDALAMLEKKLPFFSSSRATVWAKEQERANEALLSASKAVNNEQNLLKETLEKYRFLLVKSISDIANEIPRQQEDKRRSDAFGKKVSLSKLCGSIGEGISSPLVKVRKGHGRLVFQCGWTLHGVAVRTDKQLLSVGYMPLYVPCMLDLLSDRGFITSDANTVKSFILRMLNSLPAGSVRFSVYDPSGMGDFVSYLYSLGDKQEHILGKQGVLSSFNQLQHLLDATEQHIARINQRYLAGKYKDLVEYNQDAGVSFEPYRVLVINDNPQEWMQSYRADIIDKLTRIILAGSKCGVFTVIKCSSDPNIGLPFLCPHKTSTLPALATQRTTSIQSVQSVISTEIMQRKSIRHCFTVEDTVSWCPVNVLQLDEKGEKEIVDNLERALDNVGVIEVFPANVAMVAKAYQEAQSMKGIKSTSPVLEYDSSDGWWQQSSIQGITAYVGIEKANQKKPRMITFRGSPSEFGALIGGQSRSGKSTFLHALISEMIRRYSPTELELYLVDVKFGTEFKHYANVKLPHARVIALESGAEFALSILRELNENMARRYALFKKAGTAKIDDYRNMAEAEVLPRILAIIDEFSGIFEKDDAVSTEATILLTRLIQQGSAAGLHLVLASQSLSTAISIPRKVLPQIPQRILFKVPESDSRMFLADDNPQGSNLNRAGEGIFNQSNGRRDANEEFQGTLMTHDDLHKTLTLISDMARKANIREQPVILEGTGATAWTSLGLKMAKKSMSGLSFCLPIGMPLSLGNCLCVEMRQTVDGNALVCAYKRDSSIDICVAMIMGAALGGAQVMLCDFQGNGFEKDFDRYGKLLVAKVGKRFNIIRGENVYDAITKLKEKTGDILEGRIALNIPVLVVITGLSHAMQFNQFSAVSMDFKELLAKGATVGIHVAVVAESLLTIKSRLDYPYLDYFSTIISGLCNRDDSMELVQDHIASALENDEQVIIYDRLSGKAQKVRPFQRASFPGI